jgi:hypothetical protein
MTTRETIVFTDENKNHKGDGIILHQNSFLLPDDPFKREAILALTNDEIGMNSLRAFNRLPMHNFRREDGTIGYAIGVFLDNKPTLLRSYNQGVATNDAEGYMSYNLPTESDDTFIDAYAMTENGLRSIDLSLDKTEQLYKNNKSLTQTINDEYGRKAYKIMPAAYFD